MVYQDMQKIIWKKFCLSRILSLSIFSSILLLLHCCNSQIFLFKSLQFSLIFLYPFYILFYTVCSCKIDSQIRSKSDLIMTIGI